jgi:3-oxoacyl-[acyl-carrier-protein] synthase-3
MNFYAHITGWGMAVPKTILGNEELAHRIGVSADWISQQTGILERRIADAHESTAILASRAAMRALERSEIRPRNLGLIIVATSTPEQPLPSTASLVQDTLGASNTGAFDLLAGGCGFLYALSLASQAIRCGGIRSALIIGAETLSRFLDWQEKDSSIFFGDGAGAVILEASSRSGGVLSTLLRSDGSGSDLMHIPAGGSRLPPSAETVAAKLHMLQSNEGEMQRFAQGAMTSAARQALQAAGLNPEEIKLLIPSQVHPSALEEMAGALGIPSHRVLVNRARYGDTCAAAIPIALCEALEAGLVQPNDTLLMVAAGAGLTWGAAAVRWMAQARRISRARRGLLRLSVIQARLRSWLRRLWRVMGAFLYRRRA